MYNVNTHKHLRIIYSHLCETAAVRSGAVRHQERGADMQTAP